MSRVRILVVVLAAAVVVGLIVTWPKKATTRLPMPPAPVTLTSYYNQHLDWHSCAGQGQQCAWLSVPLDYAHPHEREIKIGVLRVKATGKKLGSLVINPGGPGASGMNFAQAGSGYFGPEISSRYDIVGFDPRGVDTSVPIKCGDTAQTDAVLAADPAPDTAAEWAQSGTVAKTYLDRCLKLSGEVAAHVSTDEAARDMDILRAALGDPRLNYFGASYGTYLGATYAGLFPKNVGRMVLDGALDPALTMTEMSLQQAHSLQVALDAYLTDCVAHTCPLGSSVEAARTKVEQMLTGADTNPIPTGTSRPLTEGLMMLGVWAPLYVRSNWPQLTAAFEEVLTKGTGKTFLNLADRYTGRGTTAFIHNSIAAQNAVNCLDNSTTVTWAEAQKLAPSFVQESSTFGWAFLAGLSTCGYYPVPARNDVGPIHAPGAAPIVVIGTSRDPVTPLAWAQGLAKELDSGVLVTRNGDGHTGFRQGSTCVDNAVVHYFVDGVVPRNGLAC